MKKRKLNSKNPKYWDKSQLNTPKIDKKVLLNEVKGCKIYAIWLKDDYKRDEVNNDRNDEWQLNHEWNGYV